MQGAALSLLNLAVRAAHRIDWVLMQWLPATAKPAALPMQSESKPDERNVPMKTTNTLLSSVLVALLAAPLAFAQAPAKPVPGGEADAAQAKSQGTKTSTVDRAAVKAEAKKAGTACDKPQSDMGKSTAKRADVKADAIKAQKAGEDPCGEQMPGPKK